MKRFDPLTAARDAVANRPDRAATAMVHDSPGDVFVYLPDERHGMRAAGEELLLLATITPRPRGAH
ncbi:MAG TPA: hypothetical protein VG432_14460 [Gemmatimonadaceae bacterium]|nr:hypothetical protein [Gemmatimonadaceae bacterium]